MFCIKCGKMLEENSKFCTSCGTKVEIDDSCKSDSEKISTDSNKEESKSVNNNTNSADINAVITPSEWDYEITDIKNICSSALVSVLFTIIAIYLLYMGFSGSPSWLLIISVIIFGFLTIKYFVNNTICEVFGIKFNSSNKIMAFKGNHEETPFILDLFTHNKSLHLIDLTTVSTIRAKDRTTISNKGNVSHSYIAIINGTFGIRKFSFMNENKRDQFFDLISSISGMEVLY